MLCVSHARKPGCCIEVGFIFIFFLFNWLDEYIRGNKEQGNKREVIRMAYSITLSQAQINCCYRASLCHCVRKVIVRNHLGGKSS